jgi:inosine-uridine nucleoside N-ribohydrolase
MNNNINTILYLNYYNIMKWIIDSDFSSNAQLSIEILIKAKLDIVALTISTHHDLSTVQHLTSKAREFLKKLSLEHIPVYQGASQAYINFQEELNDEPLTDPYNLTKEIVEVTKIEDINVDNSAALKIIELIKKHKKDLNILCLSQLTNLSLSILIDNSIKDDFNKLYVVGGSFTGESNSGIASEASFRYDPIAAKNVILYYSNVVVIPLEIEKLSLISERSLYNFNTYKEKMLSESKSLYHLLAICLIINSKIITKESILPGDVDITGRYTRGALSLEKYPWIESGKYNKITIVEEIDLSELDITLKTYFN